MSDTEKLKRVITQFIDERKQLALNKLKEDDPKREKIIDQYQVDNWLADAARRVPQIQVATHTIKAQHQYAQGSNIYYQIQKDRSLAGYANSDSLGVFNSQDVSGNAAALDIYRFLSLEYDNETLLSRALRHDDVFLAALHDDKSIAQSWLSAFASVTEGKDPAPRADTQIKQLYWPINENQYHVLVPLYPSSLVHHVYLDIQYKRFSEHAAEVREARKNKVVHDGTHYEFPELAVLKTGGSNPQNISILNSQRGGRSYLLPSLPPTWVTQIEGMPLGVESIFTRHFSQLKNVYRRIRALRQFFASNPKPNQKTRAKHERYLNEIIQELVNYVFTLRSLEPGWTNDVQCKLNNNEKYWLDPYRSDVDPNWQRPETHEWLDDIKENFSRFIKRSLTTDKLVMGDAEQIHWKACLDEYIRHVDQFDMEVFA